MDSRQEKIAALQAILANPTQIQPLTPAQKRGFDAARLARLDTQRELDKNIREQQKEDDDRRSLEENQSNDSFNVQEALSSVGGILQNTGDTVSRLPTPGTIATPLIILLVFFLALIPIAGNTRLKWLWLVITGDADLTSGIASGNITPKTAQTGDSVPSLPSIGVIPYMSLEV